MKNGFMVSRGGEKKGIWGLLLGCFEIRWIHDHADTLHATEFFS